MVTLRGSSESIRIRNHFVGNAAGGNQIDQIRFADGTSWNVAAIQSHLVVDRPPVLSVPLGDQSVIQGANANITLPAGSFTDPDPGDTLTWAASLSSGAALPAWLAFNAATPASAATAPRLPSARSASR